MKRNPPVKRDWLEAREKVDAEGRCRVCGRTPPAVRLEAAHVAGRAHDEEFECGACGGEGMRPHGRENVVGPCKSCNGHGRFLRVHPDDVVPLCGPATTTSTCHGRQHAHRLDLLPYLSPQEPARAVLHIGSIAGAYRALSGESGPPPAALPPGGVQDWHTTADVYPPTPPPPR